MHSLNAFLCREIDNERFFASVINVELQVNILDRVLNFRRAAHVSHWVAIRGFNLNNASTQIGKYGASAR